MKAPLSKNRRPLRCWGVGLEHKNLGGKSSAPNREAELTDPQLPVVSSLRWMCQVMFQTLAPCLLFRVPLFLSGESSQILTGSPTQDSAEQGRKGVRAPGSVRPAPHEGPARRARGEGSREVWSAGWRVWHLQSLRWREPPSCQQEQCEGLGGKRPRGLRREAGPQEQNAQPRSTLSATCVFRTVW